MTTAALFRERGWSVGTLLSHMGRGPFRVEFIGKDSVVVKTPEGREDWTWCSGDWSLYRPTPPVPTPEEWRELWGTLDGWDCNGVPCATNEDDRLADVIAALRAKVTP